MEECKVALAYFKNQKIVSCQRLSTQGYCNYNYLLRTQSQNYLLRIFKLTNDRVSEFKAQKRASHYNVGAKPLFLDLEKGFMVAHFIEGEHRYKLSRKSLALLAKMIKKLHKIQSRQRKIRLKSNFKWKHKKVQEAYRFLKHCPYEEVFSHNDLHPKNILFSKNGVKLIDWEYAGLNDRYFDLASLSIEFKWSKEEERYFFRYYFSGKKVNKKKLEAYKVIYKKLYKLWFENYLNEAS